MCGHFFIFPYYIYEYLSLEPDLTLNISIQNTGIKALFKPALTKYNFFGVKTGESLPLEDGSSLTANATVSSNSSTLTPQY